MDWIFTSLQWYLTLLVLGVIFFPLTRKIFSTFFDQGYVFAKTIAILVLTYSIFLFGTLKILPFSQTSLVLLLSLVVIVSFLIIRRHSRPDRESFNAVQDKSDSRFRENDKKRLYILLFEELLFIVAFFFLVYMRGQEPSIRGLEKFMDFGFMNSILRTRYFPALDMWYSADPTHPAGYSINYYYFGHLSGALLIKLTGIKASLGYNLILATIFAQAVTLVFSLVSNLVYLYKKTSLYLAAFFGLLGSYIVNLGGNLHTIYLFTKGYPNESPIPFWQILSTYNPVRYWYPNATRFIPFTIHEFPSYSYVVADLHGHVFDIPFVLLTLAILLIILIHRKTILNTYYLLLTTVGLGFMTAVHYMTNAFDGPIYFLLTILIFFLLFGLDKKFYLSSILTGVFFVIFSLPFSLNFNSFVSGIGVNCSTNFNFLVKLQRLGPFLFEKGNCQISPLWMLFILWGFFCMAFVLFVLIKYLDQGRSQPEKFSSRIDLYMLSLFAIGILLITIPEFFYAKDIYPAHFRANTMFKLGYQAFIMMGIAATFVLYKITLLRGWIRYIFKFIFVFFLFFVVLYPFYSFKSYYGKLNQTPQLDGMSWMVNEFPQDKEIVDYLNSHIAGQPVILEAQGDSYTDYERISANTGLPTIAGWWVHEWLWRGSSDVVGKRIPDIINIYESSDKLLTKQLLNRYGVRYVIISGLEREKYKNLNEEKFSQIGKRIFVSTNGLGAIYQVN